MDAKESVQVKVEIREHAKEEARELCEGMESPSKRPSAWDEGYEQGLIDGWGQAVVDALEKVYDGFDNPEQVQSVLFPELSKGAAKGEDVYGAAGAFAKLKTKEGQEKEPSDAYPEFSEKSAYEEDTLSLGRRGEDAAVRFLISRGYEILVRNYSCVFGEVDIIALDEEGTVVFVEVKTRRSTNTGIPEEAITKAKRKRYERIAMQFMEEADWEENTCMRFDAIGILITGNNHATLRHHIGYLSGDW